MAKRSGLDGATSMLARCFSAIFGSVGVRGGCLRAPFVWIRVNGPSSGVVNAAMLHTLILRCLLAIEFAISFSGTGGALRAARCRRNQNRKRMYNPVRTTTTGIIASPSLIALERPFFVVGGVTDTGLVATSRLRDGVDGWTVSKTSRVGVGCTSSCVRVESKSARRMRCVGLMATSSRYNVPSRMSAASYLLVLSTSKKSTTM